MPQETETLLSQGLGEDICNLLSRIYGLDDDSSITNKSSKIMVFDGNVLCSGSKLWALCNCDAAFIVFPDKFNGIIDLLLIAQKFGSFFNET